MGERRREGRVPGGVVWGPGTQERSYEEGEL